MVVMGGFNLPPPPSLPYQRRRTCQARDLFHIQPHRVFGIVPRHRLLERGGGQGSDLVGGGEGGRGVKGSNMERIEGETSQL